MLKLAFQNCRSLWRRYPAAALPLALAVALLVAIWSLVSGLTAEIFENSVGFTGGHIRITNEQNLLESYRQVEKAAHFNPGVVWTSPQVKIKSLAMSQGKRKPVLAVGFDPVKAERISALGKKLVSGRLIRSGAPEVMVGAGLARSLKLATGQKLLLGTRSVLGTISAMDYQIVGIFNAALPALDNGVVYLPLDQAQALGGLGERVNEVVVIVNKAADAPAIAAGINRMIGAGYKVQPWQEQKMMFLVIGGLKAGGALAGSFVFLLALLITYNTFNLSVLTRGKEFLNLKYLGLTGNDLVRLMLAEALVLGTVASLAGIFLGTVLIGLLRMIGLDISSLLVNSTSLGMIIPGLHRAALNWGSLGGSFLAGIAGALLAALPAARRAAKEIGFDAGFGRNPNL